MSQGFSNPQADVVLSKGQQLALDRVQEAIKARSGEFIFVTGKAGTGKSTVLNRIRQFCRPIVCAPTGLAAVNVRGMTIHSLFKLKLGPLQRSKCKALQYPELLEVADAIVIDEISMARADIIDAINAVCQKTLRSDKSFGGKTVIAFGDMMQLEPVVPDDCKEYFTEKYKSPFWFDAHVFRGKGTGDLLDDTAEPLIEIVTCELTDVFRQQGDPDFIDALNAIRIGDPSGLEFINRRAGVEPEHKPVSITFTNKKALATNARRLADLEADEMVFEAVITGDFPEKDYPCPSELSLKVGAQVMFTKNIVIDECDRVVNGAVGEIVGFLPGGPVVELRDGRVVVVPRATWDKIGYSFDRKEDRITEEVEGRFEQYPLKLAWSITVHKSQGQTLEAAVIEAEKEAFAHGQLYVALSRVKSLDGLFLRRKIGANDLRVHERIRDWCKLPSFATQIDHSAFQP